jgi:hypothetical protein
MPTVVAASTSPGPIILRRSPTPRGVPPREADSSLLKRLLPSRTTDRGQHECARKRQISSPKFPRRWSLAPWIALSVIIRQSESEYSGCCRAVNDSWLNNARKSDWEWGSADVRRTRIGSRIDNGGEPTDAPDTSSSSLWTTSAAGTVTIISSLISFGAGSGARVPDAWREDTSQLAVPHGVRTGQTERSPPPDLTFGGCRTTWIRNTIEVNH